QVLVKRAQETGVALDDLGQMIVQIGVRDLRRRQIDRDLLSGDSQIRRFELRQIHSRLDDAMGHQDHVRIIEPELAQKALWRVGKHLDFFHDVFDRDQLRQRLDLFEHRGGVIDLWRWAGPPRQTRETEPNYPADNND